MLKTQSHGMCGTKTKQIIMECVEQKTKLKIIQACIQMCICRKCPHHTPRDVSCDQKTLTQLSTHTLHLPILMYIAGALVHHHLQLSCSSLVLFGYLEKNVAMPFIFCRCQGALNHWLNSGYISRMNFHGGG